MRISDWSSDVCSSDLHLGQQAEMVTDSLRALFLEACGYETKVFEFISLDHTNKNKMILAVKRAEAVDPAELLAKIQELKAFYHITEHRSEEHTSELQSLMRISYAVFCLKKKKKKHQ